MKKLFLKGSVMLNVLAIFILLIAGLGQAKIDTKNLAGLWLFDENDGDEVKDSSGNGNHGKIMGKAKWIKGKFGSALEFDGTSYVQVSDSDSLDMGQEVSVLFWVQTYKVMKDMWADRQAIVGKHYQEYEVGIYMQAQLHTYTSNISGAGNGYDEGIMASFAGKLPDKEQDWETKKWYHVAWTLNGHHEIAYVNGVKIGEYDKPNKGTKGGAHPLEIGRRSGGGIPLTGAVDEVGIFKSVLTEEDVKTIMEKGFALAVGLTSVSNVGKLATTWGNIKY